VPQMQLFSKSFIQVDTEMQFPVLD